MAAVEVLRHREQQWPELRTHRKLRRGAQEPKPRLLKQVLGKIDPAGKSQQECSQRRVQALIHPMERPSIAPDQPLDERTVAGLGPCSSNFEQHAARARHGEARRASCVQI
jgi:hypothetical protein